MSHKNRYLITVRLLYFLAAATRTRARRPKTSNTKPKETGVRLVS